ncbi:DUF2452 domain-containing protein [Aurantibacillus circumpalustris]|uniref:DUF2452 domain-containing protein n=1 Tax=Aurantibacillus circumpalustris TaxID=3036359 RepID=UPI00295B572A|nr:DUF2452 domain-containing protein [Aurantibacillus circumpalustris]
MINPIDKDKTTETPGTLAYPHTIGSVVVKPEDVGKLKSRALSAMHEQTNRQLLQLQKQAELLAHQANELNQRVKLSELIYTAEISFEALIGHVYYLYKKEQAHRLMMIAPDEWGRKKPETLEFVSSVKLLSDHTWEIIKD